MDKQTVVFMYNGILFSYKGNKVLTHATTWMSPENIKKPDIKGQNCMILFI